MTQVLPVLYLKSERVANLLSLSHSFIYISVYRSATSTGGTNRQSMSPVGALVLATS